MLFEDSRLDSPITQGEGRPEKPASSRQPDVQSFPSDNPLGACDHMAVELNSTGRGARQMKRTPTARCPAERVLGTAPPDAYDAQGWEPTGADTRWLALEERPKMDATSASETQALPHVAGNKQQPGRVPYAYENGRGDTARG